MNIGGGWTDERIATLKRLRAEGLSCSQTAKALGGGVTRNSVISKLNRLGLSSPRAPSAPGSRPAPRAQQARPPKPTPKTRAMLGAPSGQPKPPRPTVSAIEDVTHAKPWPRRGFGECAWPIGEPAHDMLSCCAPTEDGATYCPHHARRMVQPQTTRKTSGSDLARSLRRYV